MSFPSIVAWQIINEVPQTKPDDIRLGIRLYGKDGNEIETQSYSGTFVSKIVPKEKQVPGFEMTVNSPIIVYNNADSTGTVQVIFEETPENPAEEIHLGVKGADIDAVTSRINPLPFAWDHTKNIVVIKNNATIKLTLRNLNAKTEVELIATNKKGVKLPKPTKLKSIPAKQQS